MYTHRNEKKAVILKVKQSSERQHSGHEDREHHRLSDLALTISVGGREPDSVYSDAIMTAK